MKRNFFIILVICYLLVDSIVNGLDTDCTRNGGANDKECRAKTTFVNTPDFNFIVEANTLYECCYYKGMIGEMNYEGCFPFKEIDIEYEGIFDLIDRMKNGKWKGANGQKIENPVIECLNRNIKTRLFSLMLPIIFLFA